MLSSFITKWLRQTLKTHIRLLLRESDQSSLFTVLAVNRKVLVKKSKRIVLITYRFIFRVDINASLCVT